MRTKRAKKTRPGLKSEPLSTASRISIQDLSPLSFGNRPAPLNALTVRLLMVRESVLGHLRPVLRAHGLTEQQYRVLRALQFAPLLDATSLAQRAVLLPPSLSRILKDLKKLRLIETVEGVNNRRLLRIQLSAKGQSAIEKATSDMDSVGRRIADLVGPDRLEQLMRLLDEVEERVIPAVLTS